jgi:hypothetical protein
VFREVAMMESDGRRSGVVSHPLFWFAAAIVPILLFVFTQLEFAQNAEGWFLRGVTSWDIGKRDIVADIFAPVWVVSIVVVAALTRRLLDRHAEDPDRRTTGGIEGQLLSGSRARLSTWFATLGALVIVVMSWTREWVRFGELPSAFWYVGTILVVFGLLVMPVWWVRHGLFDDVHRSVSSSRFAGHIDSYVFGLGDKNRSRWILIATFAGVTGIVAWIALGQLDALLAGMHSSGGARVGMNGLASVLEFDLSQKPAEIAERVGSWHTFSDEVGPEFAPAFVVASLYLLIDSFVLVPAYLVGIGILLLHVRRTQPQSLDDSAGRSYQLLIGIGMAMLLILASADLTENLMTWIVVRAAWFTPDTITNWTVRLMWFASAFRTIALVSLVAVGFLTIAFRSRDYRWLGDALVAVRGQLLVIVFVAAVLAMAQTEDVVRRWTVSVAFLTVAMVTALAVLVHWTATRSFALLRAERRAVQDGVDIEPARVSLPWRSSRVRLRSVVVSGVIMLAAAQVVLAGILGAVAGLGFTVAVLMIAVLWLFGVPLPVGPFERGDRKVRESIKRWFPRILGSSLYLILGISVLRSAVAQLVYARHADIWLVFCLVPILVGVYRIHTKSWPSMGPIELAVVGSVTTFGVALWIVRGDPELSPVALTFIAVMILYGAMPFYYSYDPGSLPSRFVQKRLPGLRTEPLVLVGASVAGVTGIALIAFPLPVAERIGTVAVVLLGAMLFAGFAAASVRYAERTRPPKILAAFRLKRTPVFVFMLVWLLLAGLASTGASNDVSVIQSGVTGEDRVVTVDDVWTRWESKNISGSSGNEVLPLVLIASSGGGIRAAAWTSYVMDCLFVNSLGVDECVAARDGSSSVMLMSGVSGGSLGLATWSASTLDPPAQKEDDWVKRRLGDDYLASAMAWLLLVDTPRSFIGFGPSIRGRAEVMELAWEASWNDAGGDSYLSGGIFEQWHRYYEVPFTLFNGTSVNDPCRFNVSVLTSTAHERGDTCTSLVAFEGQTEGLDQSVSLAATQDLVDYLCHDEDIKLSTAIMLSARFPVITPSGRIGGSLSDCEENPIQAFVVDGGYLDGSGAGTVTELWHGMEDFVDTFNESHTSCVVPFLIQIDNGYENPSASAAGRSPTEVLVPLQSIFNSQFGRIANEREQAAIEFDRPMLLNGSPVSVYTAEGNEVRSRYARITTRAHPGIQAPLGWTLSDASFDDLRAQMTIEENAMEISEIQAWLAGNLTCTKSI